MKNIFMLIIFLYSLAASAQAMKGSNRINLVFTPQYYFNKLYLKNDGLAPDPIHPHNTTGYYVGAEYERVTKFGLSVSVGLQYGAQSHNVDIFRDLSDFDIDAKESLKGVVFEKNTSITTTYIGPRITVGYQKCLMNNLSVHIKGGVAQKKFFNGTRAGDYITYVEYPVDYDSNNYRKPGFIIQNSIIGKDSMSNRRFPSTTNTFEFYLGVEYVVNMRHIRNISAGIVASRAWQWNNNLDFIYVKSMKSWQESNSYSLDYYFDRNVSIGLRIAVGIW